MVNKGHALSRDELIRVLTAYTGITTADGALDGTTLIDSTLIGRNDFVTEKVILIMGGNCKDEDKGAVSFNSGDGTITLQGTGFSAQIKKGTIYRILNISSVEIDVAAINSKIGTNTDPPGTTTLFAYLTNIFGSVGTAKGLVFYGTVTQVDDATHFRVSSLTGFGDDYFANTYRVYVVRDAGGAGAAPQGEMQPCSSYDTTNAIFAHTAFTTGLAVGDEVLLLQEMIAEILDLMTRLGDPTADTLTSIAAKWGNIARSLDAILGARWDASGDLGTDIASLLTDLGDASGDTLTSVIAKWGDIARSLDLILGSRWDAAGDLGTDIVTIITDIGTVLSRLTAARAGYLDELAAANIPADIDTLLSRLTATRAGYLDELDFDLQGRLGMPSGASISADIATLLGRLTAARAGYLDELSAANIPADIDTLNTKVGTNVDAAGTTTLFARLRQIVDNYLADGTVGLSALKALIDDLETKLDRLRGESPVTGSVTGNWQSGMGTSGETGADLVTIGANDTKYKLHSLIVSIHNLASGAKATIKLFQQVNGTERKVYEEVFNKDSVPDGCWVVNGTVGIHEAVRVEVESNKVADNGVAIDYDYMLEVM